MTRSWTGPADIRTRLERAWAQGHLLVPAPGTEAFPWRIPLRQPSAAEIAARFDEVRAWIRTLQESSRAAIGVGYELVWGTVNHRQLGSNAIPSEAIIPSLDDALALLERRVDAERFTRLLNRTSAICPTLLAWIQKRPLVALACSGHWDSLLQVVSFFLAHPRPGLYLRQLDLPGINTKFIESQSSVIATLLDAALPSEHIDRNFSASRSFEQRYGLQAKPVVIRLRILDPRMAIAGLNDIAAPLEQLACLPLSPAQVIITENEINGLCLPERAGTITLFGLGYAAQMLANLPWLAPAPIAYWGDIDTHGFAMLDRLRQVFPQARSLLMDAETFHTHRQHWVREAVQHRGALERLNAQEDALLQDLLAGRPSRNLRLEQERISFQHVLAGLRAIGLAVPDPPGPPAAQPD